MEIEVVKLSVQIAVSVGAAFLAAWLAAKRFKEDRLWEKKMEAYADLVDALHKMKFPPGEHFDAAIGRRDIDKEYSTELWREFSLARRNVLRIAESSSLLLSPELMEVVEEMESRLSNADHETCWEVHLDTQWAAINECLKKVKRIAGRELGIKHTHG
ncbi:MAG: hypothetical protein SD837_19590 [Candidatus Electrothrix scaldis]|nr:MAG: hypothetical protein SD837_19590 [Candidatus Electrothrix sp. GW3-3]